MRLRMKINHRNNHQRAGYVMILTLIIVSLSVVLATYLARRSTIFNAFASTAIKREKAKMLALSGIQIAMSQLASTPEKDETKDKDQKAKKSPSDKFDKHLLKTILPTLNRWQTFILKEEVDGVDGKIKIVLSSEEGKIDINQIYDFKEDKFVGEGQKDKDYKEAMETLFARIAQLSGGKNLFADFEKFLNDRKRKVHDVTELLTSKNFAAFKDTLFYVPREKEGAAERPVYLADIFTTWSPKKTVEPWLMSDSMLAILEIDRATAGDVDKRRESVREWLQGFKKDPEWRTDWDNVLKPVYGKDFNSFSKGIHFILNTHFEPTVFSVLSYGEFESVGQRLLAIVQRIKKKADNGDAQFEIKIRKLYWL